MKILSDDSLLQVLPMEEAIVAVENFFKVAAKGKVISPPRHAVKAGTGGLTFTIGADPEATKTIGFRVYPTYPTGSGTKTDQIVAVYSTDDGALKGLVIGSLLGAIRTAAINGVAIKYLTAENIQNALLIGAGHQAFLQAKALLAVRSPAKLTICNRTLENASRLANRLRELHQVRIETSTDIKTAVQKATLILCATSAVAPVLQMSWLNPEAYVASIGPKFKTRHELPLDVADYAGLLVSDAVDQLGSYSQDYFLEDRKEIQPLEDFVAGKNADLNRIRVFLSSGRSGTEVVVADRALAKAGPG